MTTVQLYLYKSLWIKFASVEGYSWVHAFMILHAGYMHDSVQTLCTCTSNFHKYNVHVTQAIGS